jgi:hypothetical protein
LKVTVKGVRFFQSWGEQAAVNSAMPEVPLKQERALTLRGLRIRGAKARSKVTNGVKLIAGLDGRSVWGRRFYDLCASHAADAGGPETLSEAQISLIRRASALEVTLEMLEKDMAEGRDVDLDQYSRSAGHLRRILEAIGIKRVAKDVTPTLRSIIERHGATDR